MAHPHQSVWIDWIQTSISSLQSDQEKICLYFKLALKSDPKWSSDKISNYAFSCLDSIDLPLMNIIQLSVPFFREVQEYGLLQKYSAYILNRFVARREELDYSGNETHPLSKLCNSIPQLLPFLLTSSIALVNRDDNGHVLYKDFLPFYIFIASSSWSSALSKNRREILENFLLLPCSEETVKLLIMSLSKIKSNDYDSLAVLKISLEHISFLLSKCTVDVSTILSFLDALSNFSKNFSLNILDLSFDLWEPLLKSSIKGFVSLILLLTAFVSDSSKDVLIRVVEILENVEDVSPLINLAKFVLGKELNAFDNNQLIPLSTSMISSLSSADLRYFCLVYNCLASKSNSYIFVKESNTTLQKMQFYCLCSNLINGTFSIDELKKHVERLAEFLLDESCEDVDFGLGLVVQLLKRCNSESFRIILLAILRLSTKDAYSQNWAIQIFTILNQYSKLRLRTVDFLCQHLKSYPFVFPFVQATLSTMFKSSRSKARQVLFAICARRLVECDNRQSILNFSFSCSTQFFAIAKTGEVFGPACALILNTLWRLAALKYVDPRSIWKNFVDGVVLQSPYLQKDPEVIGNCILIASQIISCHKIDVNEPIPEDILYFLEWIVNSAIKFKNDFVWDCAGKGFLSFDYLYYANHIPLSSELLGFLSKLELSNENSIFAFLKMQLDREISSMARSMFLGNTSANTRPRTQNSMVIDNALVEKNLKLTSTQWKITPYFFESFVKQSLLACKVDEKFLDQLDILGLINMPSTLQMHWKSRLDLVDNLAAYIWLTLKHLNEIGKLSEIAKEFLLAANKMVAEAQTPTNIVNGLLLITSFEIAQADITKDYFKLQSLFNELLTIGFPESSSNSTGRVSLGRFTDNEEIIGGILLAIISILKKVESFDALNRLTAIVERLSRRVESGKDVWLGLALAHLQKRIQAKPTKSFDSTITSVFQALASHDSVIQDEMIDSLESLIEKGIDSNSVMKAISLAIISANNPSPKLLETLRDLHTKANIAEPSDLKSMISIHVSRMAQKCEENADLWLNYLVARLEKPGPAVIKADAAIALQVLLFEDKSSTLASKATKFFTQSLPVLLSSTSDMRLLSWFVNLMIDYQSSVLGGNHSNDDSEYIDVNRFGKDSGFGVVLDFIRGGKLINHLLSLLTSLRTLPRVDWTIVLSDLVPKYPLEILELIAAHGCSALTSGGHYISPSLSSLFKTRIIGLKTPLVDENLWKSAARWLEMFGASERYDLLMTCLESTSHLKIALETMEKVLPSLEVDDQERRLSLTLQIVSALPNPYDSNEWRLLYEIGAKVVQSLVSLEELEDSERINLIRFLSCRTSNGYDPKQVIRLLRTFDFNGLVSVIALELANGVPSNDQRIKFVSSFLELFMIEANLHHLIPQLIILFICNWPSMIFKDLLFVDLMHRLYFVEQQIPKSSLTVDHDLVSICWDAIDKTMLGDELLRLQRRLIKILQEQVEFGRQIDPFTADLFELLL